MAFHLQCNISIRLIVSLASQNLLSYAITDLLIRFIEKSQGLYSLGLADYYRGSLNCP